jgi:hypothetical protein
VSVAPVPVLVPSPAKQGTRAIPFEIAVGGLLQVTYLGRATENHLARRLGQTGPAVPPAGSSAGTPVLDESTLLLGRARLSAGGYVASPGLTYFLEADAATGSVEILEYRLRVELGRRTALNVGQMRVPYSYSWSIREHRLVFPVRSIATDAFRYNYDIGLSLETMFLSDRLTLIVGGYNGGGAQLLHNDNLDPMLVVRLEGRSLRSADASPEEGPPDEGQGIGLVLGASVVENYLPTPPAYGFLSGTPQGPRQLVVDANMDGLADGITTVDAEIDAKLTYRMFAFETEFYYRHEWWHDIPALQPPSPTAFSPETQFWGVFGQILGGFASDRVLGGARLAFTRLSPLSPGGQRYETHTCIAVSGQDYACALPYADSRFEASGVVALRIVPRTLQISAMYSFLRWATTSGVAPADPKEHRLIGLVQLSF